eukprot:PhF_6_TR41635/c0_g1_i2/m.63103/K12035/TRIM71; tripartite motif-containing protein 71
MNLEKTGVNNDKPNPPSDVIVYGSHGCKPGQFNYPFGICQIETPSTPTDTTSSRLAVVDKKNRRVVILQMNSSTSSPTSLFSVVNLIPMTSPRDCAWHVPSRTLLVTDSAENVVRGFHDANADSSSILVEGLDAPHGLDVLFPSHMIVIVDCHRNRIVLADTSRREILQELIADFDAPHMVCSFHTPSHDDCFVVSDYKNHRIVLCCAFPTMCALKSFGSSNRVLRFPVGLTQIAGTTRVAVVDNNNHRVVVFECGEGGDGEDRVSEVLCEGMLKFPGSVVYLQPHGLLAITDHNNHRIVL